MMKSKAELVESKFKGEVVKEIGIADDCGAFIIKSIIFESGITLFLGASEHCHNENAYADIFVPGEKIDANQEIADVAYKAMGLK